MSELAEISQNTLSSIETGNYFFSADSLEQLIAALDVEADELFDIHHQKSSEELLKEINKMLMNNPEKIVDIHKIWRTLIF